LNYPTHDRELMAVFLAVKKWRSYLDGHKCKVITDHRPLEHIQTQPHVTRRQARWMEWLGEFALTWEYRPGKEGVAPDALSRIMTMVVEPGWLARVYRAQVATDEEMSRLRAKAGTVDGTFRLVDKEGLQLLYRCTGAGN
jgi:RNase H-like domain found in reverse transcriptase